MDPKTDPGVDASKAHTTEERIALGTLPMISELTSKQKIAIMDQLLRFEVKHNLVKYILTNFSSCGSMEVHCHRLC